MRNALALSILLACLPFSKFAAAQAPQAPTPLYAGRFGGGFALTSGNTDTKNFNLSFGLVRDPKTKNLLKVDALYLRGSQNDVLSLDRSTVRIRNEYKVSQKAFVFGQMDYLRDEFKDIRYLLAPIAGVGYYLMKTDETSLSFSGASGGVWEKNSGGPVKKSGNLNAGQTFSRKLSSTAVFSGSIGSFWKTSDFDDSLTDLALGLTTSINNRLELKIEFLDSYKSKPPNTTIKKNDTAFVTAFVVKF